jgi:sugar lactone lactonase YvrE
LLPSLLVSRFPGVSLESLGSAGAGLHRPECVLCTASGDVFTADWRGGVARISHEGDVFLLAGRTAAGEALPRPNGIALLPDGSFLLADLSEERAGVWRLRSTGELEPFLLEVNGTPLPPVNFVCTDSRERVWITVSTRLRPRALDYRPTASTGFVVLVEGGTARIVADGLGYTNECRLDPEEEHLYVNETFARRTTRFRIAPDGSLSGRETVATFGAGTFPDGLVLDEEGALWITSIVSNRVIRVDPDGRQEVVLEDVDADHLASVEHAFETGRMDRPHLDSVRSKKLRNVSSLAFGGPDLRTVYLGCLLGESLVTFRSPVAGLPPIHWKYNVPEWR